MLAPEYGYGAAGSPPAEIDQARRLVYVHVLGVGSPGSVDAFYTQVTDLERLLVNAFERDADWQPVARDSEEGAQR